MSDYSGVMSEINVNSFVSEVYKLYLCATRDNPYDLPDGERLAFIYDAMFFVVLKTNKDHTKAEFIINNYVLGEIDIGEFENTHRAFKRKKTELEPLIRTYLPIHFSYINNLFAVK